MAQEFRHADIGIDLAVSGMDKVREINSQVDKIINRFKEFGSVVDNANNRVEKFGNDSRKNVN